MATIKNVINTQFTSNGTAKVVKDTESISRAQTRLGQASASNARQFAAQANGLGGLVAAYAGAAATIFSVQAAFEALAKAAQAETIVRGTSALAAMTSQSGPRIIKIIQDITDGQLTMTEAAQNANIALSAGFNTQQIEQFANIAQKASQALGRDFTDSLQRIVRGVSKLEPELLDELGIFTRIEPAVQAYARELGIAAGSLNEFQRRQAFANAAIEEGNRKFSAIDTTSDSLQKTLEQLRVQISELSTGFLQIVGTALAPVISFLTNDVGNALLAFGLLLSLVFGKSTEVIGGFVNRTGNQLSGWADFVADKAKLATDEITNLQKAISKPISAEKGAGLSGIQTKARAGQNAAQAKRFADALELQRASANITPSQLNTINAAYKEQLSVLEKLGSQGTQSYSNLNAAIARNEKVLGKSSAQIKGFIGLSNTLKTSAALLTVSLSALGTVVNSVFAVVAVAQLVGTLFDVDLLGMVVNMFKDMSTATKELTTGFTSLTTAAAGGGAALTKSLTIAGASEEDIANFGDRLANLRAEVEKNAKTYEVLSSGEYYTTQEIPATQATRLEAVNKLIAERQALIAGGTTSGFFGTSQEDIEQARTDIVGLNLVLAVLQDNSEGAARVISQLAAASGLSGEKVATLLTEEIKNSNEQLVLLGINIEKIDGTYSLENLTETQLKLLEAVVLSRNGVADFYDSIESGNLSAITAGSSIAGLESKLLELNQAYKDIEAREEASEANRSASTAASKAAIEAEIAALDADLAIFRQVETALIAREKTFKDITSTFSKEISLLDTAEVTGIVDAYGRIATTQDQINVNQANYLRNIIQTTAYAKDLVGSQEKINQYIKDNNLIGADSAVIQATIAKDADNYDKALAAVNGKLVDITRQANEAAKAFDEIYNSANQTIKEMQQQATILPLQVAIDDLQVRQEAANAAASFKQELLENQIQLIELQVSNKKKEPVAGAEEINVIKDQILEAQRAALTEQFAISNQIIDAEQALLLQETEVSQANIRAEAELQRSKIDSDLAVLQSAASIYSSIASQLETSLVSGGNAVGQAIVAAINSGVAAFVGSFGQFGSLLGLSAKVAGFTPVAAAGAAEVAGPVGRGGDAFTASAIGMSDSSIQLSKALQDAGTSANKAKTAVTALEKEQLKASATSYLAERSAIEKKRELNRQAYEQEVALLLQKGEINKAEAEKRLREAAESGGGGADKKAELTEIENMLQSLFDSIKSNIQTALMSLNDLIFYGEGNFGDIMGNLFKSIQQDLFKTTIADPLSGFLTDSLFGALGITGMRTGIENAKVENGALLVKLIQGPEDLLGGLFSSGDSKDKEAAKGPMGWIGNLFSKEGPVAQSFSNLFGEGGFLSNLLQGFGSLLGSIFKAIFGGIFGGGMAQGGMVHLAQGGAAVSASLSRDRVPAMLEPGEFVLRKQSARKIGLPALQAMNATGSAGGAGNVAVNVTNEGSPKDAQASQPRFDGEKYVIDIVMRDISNNGPIRRSLRGRGGL